MCTCSSPPTRAALTRSSARPRAYTAPSTRPRTTLATPTASGTTSATTWVRAAHRPAPPPSRPPPRTRLPRRPQPRLPQVAVARARLSPHGARVYVPILVILLLLVDSSVVAQTTYTGGQRATYHGDLWTASWWTLGDTPGGSGTWRPLSQPAAFELMYSVQLVFGSTTGRARLQASALHISLDEGFNSLQALFGSPQS